jgi:hypothetical protein
MSVSNYASTDVKPGSRATPMVSVPALWRPRCVHASASVCGAREKRFISARCKMVSPGRDEAVAGGFIRASLPSLRRSIFSANLSTRSSTLGVIRQFSWTVLIKPREDGRALRTPIAHMMRQRLRASWLTLSSPSGDESRAEPAGSRASRGGRRSSSLALADGYGPQDARHASWAPWRRRWPTAALPAPARPGSGQPHTAGYRPRRPLAEPTCAARRRQRTTLTSRPLRCRRVQ